MCARTIDEIFYIFAQNQRNATQTEQIKVPVRVRIKDIALKAGVSTGTVDRVIHNRGNVATKVKEHVERVMTEMGYKRNLIASTLAYNKTLRIAALIFDQDDPYWFQINQGLEKAQEATLHYGVNLDTFFCDQGNPVMFQKLATEIVESHPDAVLVAPLFLKEGLHFLQLCAKKGIPVAIINTQMPKAKALCYIGQDSYQSGFIAARLLNFGMKKKATVLLLNLDPGPTNAQHLLDKERGFREYFKDDGKSITVLSENFEQYRDQKALKSWFIKILGKYKDLSGVFVTNSRAYMLLDCIDKRYFQDIVMVGFDLVGPNIEYLKSNRINFLINQNPVLQGYLGVINLVNHLILRQEVAQIQYLPLDIVVRENCDYYTRANVSYPATIF
ncbi:MAG: substrate-binding domain-containing protein [Saprospiraceae bacterium]|nr:substrate-binding domain-containing protein [Saprospiraceae bacterium]